MEILEIRKEIITNLKEDLPELVDKVNFFNLVKLPSKKNSVVHLRFNRPTERFPRDIVVKIFRTNNMEVEYRILKQLDKQEICVPKILFYKQPFIILEKVEGMNLCDYINDKLRNSEDLSEIDKNHKESIQTSIEKLALWLGNFHSLNVISKNNPNEIIVLNKGDTRLRDFIYDSNSGTLFGTDFEDSYEGNHIDDIAWICCSLLDTKPGIFEMRYPKHKINLINFFLKSYYKNNPDFNFNFYYFTERLIENLNIVMRRRHINMILNKENFIKDISKEL